MAIYKLEKNSDRIYLINHDESENHNPRIPGHTIWSLGFFWLIKLILETKLYVRESREYDFWIHYG